MKIHSKVFLLLLASMTFPALAVRPIHCQSVDHKYVLNVETEEPLSAILLIDGQMPRFGKLICSRSFDAWSRPRIDCRSADVADAGYDAQLVPGPEHYTVKLREQSFVGPRHLADLECDN